MTHTDGYQDANGNNYINGNLVSTPLKGESSKVTTDAQGRSIWLEQCPACLEHYEPTPRHVCHAKQTQSNLIMEVIRTFTDDRGIPMSTDEFQVLKHRIEEVL